MAEKNYRRCVGCRTVAHRDQLWRIVRTFPDHSVQLDQGMGRSAYLCAQESCLRAAQRKNRLSRILGAPVPPNIYQALEGRLVQPKNLGE